MSDLVADLSDLGSDSNPWQKTCRVTYILEQLDEEQTAALMPLLDPACRISAAKVAHALTKWGYKVGYQSIQRHRRRANGTGCLCP